MDLVIALAAERGAAVALANDPDADRLGAAIPQPDGSWRRIGGDELGWLLADHILRNPIPDDGELADRLVITTLVSSSLLEQMAADHGVHFAETFTGFKWIGRKVVDNPDWRFVFGYEQALGYLVAPRPLDKDGITAAVLMAEIAAVAAEEGTTLQARLDEIAARYGRHVIADRSVMMEPAQAAERVRELLADPPDELGGAKVVDVTSYPEADLLRLTLDGGVRVQVRPSGTEPKVKLYGEAIDADPTPLHRRARGLDSADALRVPRWGVGRQAGGPNWRSPASPSPGTMNAWSFRCSSTVAVTTCTDSPAVRSRSIPSGAQSAHTTMIGSGAPRSRSSSHVWTSDPPVASIGSTTITGRPASDSGSLLTYGLGANVSSSRLIPTNPTSASGSNSWAAWTNPSPARRIGTTTGWTASRLADASVSGVVTVVSTVGSDSVARARSRVPMRSRFWRNSAFGVVRSRIRASASATRGCSTTVTSTVTRRPTSCRRRSRRAAARSAA